MGKGNDNPQGLEARVDDATAKQRRLVKSYVVDLGPARLSKAQGDAAATTTLPEKDVFLSVHDKVVEPPYDPARLSGMLEVSAELAQAVEAMELNCDGFGQHLQPVVNVSKLPEDEQRMAATERLRLERWLRTVALGQRISFTRLRRRLRRDLESTGNAYLEVVPTRDGKGIAELRHIPSQQMRLGLEGDDLVEVREPVLEIGEDGIPQYQEQVTYKRFRTYVQGVEGTRSTRTRWFKEWGDPRTVDNTTGDLVPEENLAELPAAKRANEVLHFALYAPRTPYGIPRWVANTAAALGEREAGEINLRTMRNNLIPSMVVTVADGRLTPGSVTRMRQFMEESVRGDRNYSRFLVLEAEGNLEGEDVGTAKVEIKPLADLQRTDAMFPRYIELTKDSVRRSFRLPGIFVGATKDLAKAAAEEARKLADEQVFSPEREDFDWLLNTLLVARMRIRYWQVISHTPNVTDNEELISMLANAERTGGITPRIARMVVEDVFPVAAGAPPMDPAKVDPDTPFALQLAAAVQNKASVEVATQVAPVVPARKDEAGPVVIRKLLEVGDRAAEEIRRLLLPSAEG